MSSQSDNGIVIQDLKYEDEAAYMCRSTLYSGKTSWFETDLIVRGTYVLGAVSYEVRVQFYSALFCSDYIISLHLIQWNPLLMFFRVALLVLK